MGHRRTRAAAALTVLAAAMVAGPATPVAGRGVTPAAPSQGPVHSGLTPHTIEFEQGAPELQLSDGEIDFGTVAIGDGAERSLTATNVGTAALVIGGVGLDGDGGMFRLLGDGCSQVTLPPGAACDLTVEFRPSDVGDVGGVLTVASADPGGPSTATLLGTGRDPTAGDPGGDPELELSHDGIDFGTVEVGDRAERLLTAANVGTAETTVHGVRLDGDGPGAFSVPGDGCAQQVLSPGDSCELTIAFHPTDEGRAGTDLLVMSDDPGSPHAVTLAGESSARPVQVPDLLGMTSAQAEEAVRAVRLSLQPEGGDGAEGARVRAQRPAAGRTVDVGTPVVVTLGLPSQPPNDDGLGTGLLWALAGVLGGVVVAGALSGHSTRWVRKHVGYRPRSDAGGKPAAEQLSDEASHAVRIVTRPDAGIQTVDEVTR